MMYVDRGTYDSLYRLAPRLARLANCLSVKEIVNVLQMFFVPGIEGKLPNFDAIRPPPLISTCSEIINQFSVDVNDLISVYTR